MTQCAKRSKKEEALAEIQRLTRGDPKEGAAANAAEPTGKIDPKTKTKAPTQAIFIHVAKQFSEDKASQGMMFLIPSFAVLSCSQRLTSYNRRRAWSENERLFTSRV